MYKPVKDGIEKGSKAVVYLEAHPPAQLSELVHCFWEIKTKTPLPQDFLYHVIPDACVNILFNQIDPIVKPEAIDVFAEEMTEAKADWQVHCYGHAKHAFTFVGADIPELGIKYNAEAHQRSLKSTDEFLKEVFKP